MQIPEITQICVISEQFARGQPPPLDQSPAAKRGKTTAEKIAKEYETSGQMARFRLNVSGVFVQVGRERPQSRGRLARPGDDMA